MKKPNMLYWYENMKVMKHKIECACAPQFISIDEFGERWRCRHDNGDFCDFYGYTKLSGAKSLEIIQTEKEIYLLKEHLKRLKKN